MLAYLKLKFTLLNRHIIAFGLPPWAGWVLGTLLFILGSLILFAKSEKAPVLFVFLGVVSILPLSEHKRVSFLKTVFPLDEFYKIRVMENAITISPFVVFLAFMQLLWPGLGLLAMAILLSVYQAGLRYFIHAIPTPFYRYPYEFAAGFRQLWPFILGAYGLTIIGLVVGNFNLGLFALLLTFAVCLGFYGKPEPVYYVWINHNRAKAFLHHKLRVAILYSTVLCLPILFGLGIQWPHNIGFILLGFGFGIVYLITNILAKYTAFPHIIGIQHAILLGLGLVTPPLLLFIGPFFYTKAIKKLQPYLG